MSKEKKTTHKLTQQLMSLFRTELTWNGLGWALNSIKTMFNCFQYIQFIET